MVNEPRANLAESPSTAADLRALRARHRVHMYVLATRVRLNPGTLSAILNERQPLPAELAARIERALTESRT